ncbi:MAG: PIN domain-containing protein [Burkholderiaceae bacterium]
MSTHKLGFLDTNVLLYLLDQDTSKADLAEALLATKPIISIQVLSEFTSVARRKLALAWNEIEEITETIREVCSVESLTLDTYGGALRLSERYGMPWYDAMIMSSALLAGCATLYSEDFQHGQLIDRKLKVINPFA